MSDIFAGQGAPPAELARGYDFEHDEVTEDLDFWRELSRCHGGATLDLGCGSGRLFGALLGGGATALIGVDGSPSLLARAEIRVEADPLLKLAVADGRLRTVTGDVRALPTGIEGPFDFVVLAGVLPHLAGGPDAVRALAAVAGRLGGSGRVAIDLPGSGQLPDVDLPLSIDWERCDGDVRVVRRSRLTRTERADGLFVAYTTRTDRIEADGTIARLPASFALWYPSEEVLRGLIFSAGMTVEAVWGSYDLEPHDELASDRLIVVAAPR